MSPVCDEDLSTDHLDVKRPMPQRPPGYGLGISALPTEDSRSGIASSPEWS